MSGTLRKRHDSNAVPRLSVEALPLLPGFTECNPNGIAVTDSRNRLVLFNQRYLDLWGFDRQNMARMSVEARMFHQRQQQVELPDDKWPSTLEINRQSSFLPRVFELKDGRCFERHAYHHVVHGRKTGMVIHWRDVTALHDANQAA